MNWCCATVCDAGTASMHYWDKIPCSLRVYKTGGLIEALLIAYWLPLTSLAGWSATPPPPVTGILALDRRVTGGPGDSDLVTSHWGADSLGPRFLHWCRLLRRCILIRTATSFSVTMCGAPHTALKQAIHPLTNVFTFLSRSPTLISWGVSVEDTICDLFSRNLCHILFSVNPFSAVIDFRRQEERIKFDRFEDSNVRGAKDLLICRIWVLSST